MKRKVEIKAAHGDIEGMYVTPATEDDRGIVAITNGHNGFYGYGMFPYIQDKLADAGIASYSYNFSHGGVRNGEDYFSDLAAYEKNCMRLETADLISVLQQIGEITEADASNRLFLLSHSLGFVPTIFAAKEALKQGIGIAGVISLAAIKTLDVFPEPMMEEWKQKGTYPMKNNRTKQQLPQGPEFLSEILASEGEWNVEGAFRQAPTNYLFIHGEQDTDVPLAHSSSLHEWARQEGFTSELQIIEGAGHTFNTSHPFACTTPELDKALAAIISWLERV